MISRSPGVNVLLPRNKTSTNSRSALVLSGLTAMGPRMPGKLSGTLMCAKVFDLLEISCRSSKEKLQSDLDHPRAHIRLDLTEGRRLDVADRQPEICVVEDIEQLTAELEFFGLRQSNILQRREVPVRVSRALDYVAAFVAELLHGRERVLDNSLKRIHVEPFRRCTRTGIRIANNVGAVAGKPRNFRSLSLQGNIVGIEYREGRAAHRGKDSIHLPVAQNMSVPRAGVLQVWNAPLIAQHQTIASIEHGTAALGSKIVRVLRQIIFSRDRLRG